MEYIPERLDVAFVKNALLPYIARYIPKWEGYDPSKYSISVKSMTQIKMEALNGDAKVGRDNNKECARIFDGLRSVWNKWKKYFFL